jgi:hypothetical protein
MIYRKGISRLLANAAPMVLLSIGSHADAATQTIAGYLNDTGNAALIGSVGYAPYVGTPSFGSDADIANNVALYSIAVTTAGQVEFQSQGFALGGVDPYFTLFAGTGAGASLLGSNYGQAFSTGGDFDLFFDLLAGSYTVALGAFANMSFAENYGTGILGDGFVGLGEPGMLGNYFYQLAVTLPDPTGHVPEPSSVLLMLLGLSALALARRGSNHSRQHALPT